MAEYIHPFSFWSVHMHDHKIKTLFLWYIVHCSLDTLLSYFWLNHVLPPTPASTSHVLVLSRYMYSTISYNCHAWSLLTTFSCLSRLVSNLVSGCTMFPFHFKGSVHSIPFILLAFWPPSTQLISRYLAMYDSLSACFSDLVTCNCCVSFIFSFNVCHLNLI